MAVGKAAELRWGSQDQQDTGDKGERGAHSQCTINGLGDPAASPQQPGPLALSLPWGVNLASSLRSEPADPGVRGRLSEGHGLSPRP